MRAIKKTYVTRFVIAFATLSVGLVLVAPSVSAAAAKCYSVQTQTLPWTVTEEGCDNGVFAALGSAQFPGGFKDDHCYILGFQGMALISELPKSDELCVNAKANAQQPGSGSGSGAFSTGDAQPTADVCGSGDSKMGISINIGCRGQGNGIVDMTFAIIRFLSIGVGIIAVASIIVGGIQYTTSSGNPEATAKAISRLSNTAIALLLYFLIFAILNWLVPGGVF